MTASYWKCTTCGAEGSVPCTCMLDRIKAENEQLKEELADIEDATKGAMDEKCDLDERHCTCVPLLRAEVKQLRAIVEPLEELRAEATSIVTISADCPKLGNWSCLVAASGTKRYPEPFTGYTLAEALAAAVKAKREAVQPGGETQTQEMS